MEISKVIVDKMYSSDNFSKWLGIEILDVSQGYCKLKMKVTILVHKTKKMY